MLQSFREKLKMRPLLDDERGTSSAEYALILCVVGVGIGAAMLVLGNNVGGSMNGKVSDFDPVYAGSGSGSGSGGSGGNGSGGGSSGSGSTTTDTGGTDTTTVPGNSGGGNAGGKGKGKN